MFHVCLIWPCTHRLPINNHKSVKHVVARRSLDAVCFQAVAAGCSATPPAEPDKKEIAELAAFPVPAPRGHLCNSWPCVIYQLADSVWGGKMEAGEMQP